ncbi:MAG: Gfo/Idh/MocA family oxidoreductase [Negativicutes bacterium]|jgi:predicted dehydrogenase
MKKIKSAIIGTGFIGAEHIEAVRRLGYVEIVALAEVTQIVADQKCAQFFIPRGTANWHELVNDPKIDVIHNCTGNNLHHEINKAALQAGKHILSEKPLALTPDETSELARLAMDSCCVNAVNLNYRQFAQVQNARANIAAGKLGEVTLAHGSYLQDWLLFDTDYNWRLDPKLGGESRALADIGSHWCDTIMHVTGAEIVEVLADVATIIPVRKRAKTAVATFSNQQLQAGDYEAVPISTEDYATVIFRLSNGARGVFTVSQVSAGKKNCFKFEIDGSKAALAWNQEEPEKLWFGYREKANEVMLADGALFAPDARQYLTHPGGHNEGWPDGLKNMMANFYGYIRAGKDVRLEKPSFATFADGDRVMKVIAAILQSGKTGCWVKVNS